MEHLRAIGLMLLGLLLVASQAAYGHAYLDYTDPPLGSVVEESPSQFHLYFNERIDPDFSSFALVNEVGEVLVPLEAKFLDDDRHVRIDFEFPLADGLHRIAWKIVSAVDAHDTNGLVPFKVGSGKPIVEIHQHEGVSESPSILRVIARWLSYVGMLVLVGSLLFTLLLTSKLSSDERLRSSWSKLIWISLGIFIVAELIDVLLQVQAVGGGLLKVLLESQWGMARSGKFLFVGSIALLSLLPFTDLIRIWGSRTAGLLMILVHASASHNAGMIGTSGFIFDAVHMLAAALWLGGLVQLALGNLIRQKDLSEPALFESLGITVSRFSQMALVSVGLLIATGLLTVTYHIPTFSTLFESLYVQALAAKVGLLLIVIGIAAANRLHFVPKIKKSEIASDGVLKFRRLLTIESILIVAILFFAGVMTTTSPPHDHGDHDQVAQQPIVVTQQLEDATIDLTIFPENDAGVRRIEIRVLDPNGAIIEGIQRVRLNMTYLDEDLGGVEIAPDADETSEAGLFQISGAYLNLDGNWEAEVSVRVQGRAVDIVGVFEVSIDY